MILKQKHTKENGINMTLAEYKLQYQKREIINWILWAIVAYILYRWYGLLGVLPIVLYLLYINYKTD